MAEHAAAHLQVGLVTFGCAVEVQGSEDTLLRGVYVEVVEVLGTEADDPDDVVSHLWEVSVAVGEQPDNCFVVWELLGEEVASEVGVQFVVDEGQSVALDFTVRGVVREVDRLARQEEGVLGWFCWLHLHCTN